MGLGMTIVHSLGCLQPAAVHSAFHSEGHFGLSESALVQRFCKGFWQRYIYYTSIILDNDFSRQYIRHTRRFGTVSVSIIICEGKVGKTFPVQAVEALRVVRGWGSHIFRYSTHRWRQGCQPYAPAAFYPPGRFLLLISVRGWVDSRAKVRLEGLKKSTLSGTWTGGPPVCSIVPQPTTLPRAPLIYKGLKSSGSAGPVRRSKTCSLKKPKWVGFFRPFHLKMETQYIRDNGQLQRNIRLGFVQHYITHI
jgi:hypothetical protein